MSKVTGASRLGIGLLVMPILAAACGGPTATGDPAPRPGAGETRTEPLGRPVEPTPHRPEREEAGARAEREREATERREREEREREEREREEREREEREREERERERDAAEAAASPAEAERADRPIVPVLDGAVLPRQRIVAFYGNPASTRMGVLGEAPPDEMLRRLDQEVEAWREADPLTPVVPALHVIAVMATADPGADSLYRLRLPARLLEDVIGWAGRRDALVFVDVQVGRSSVAAELPRLERWLRRPDVHLGLDPEWAMAPDEVPGARIGSMSAEDVNHAVDFLAELVERYHLPPKVLVVHRFTQSMLRNARDIRLDPRVQVVIHMDGWGPPAQKLQTYRDIVAPEADQFTGFKLFFRNDLRGGSRLLSPAEILRLEPPPLYIQYQ